MHAQDRAQTEEEVGLSITQDHKISHSLDYICGNEFFVRGSPSYMNRKGMASLLSMARSTSYLLRGKLVQLYGATYTVPRISLYIVCI